MIDLLSAELTLLGRPMNQVLSLHENNLTVADDAFSELSNSANVPPGSEKHQIIMEIDRLRLQVRRAKVLLSEHSTTALSKIVQADQARLTALKKPRTTNEKQSSC